MAKHGFQRGALSDEDLPAMAIGGQTGQTLVRLFVVLALTFAAAYYVPLYRTHNALVAEYGSLSARVTTLENDLAHAKLDVRTVAAKNAELAARHQAGDVNREQRTAQLLKVETDLSSKFAPQIEKREMSIGLRGESVRITLPSALTESHDRPELTSYAQAALCNVAGQTATGPFGLSIVTQNDGTSKGTHSAWEIASARAAAVARILEQKCRYPGDRITAKSRTGTDAGSIDIEIASIER
jgi:flagellar motor protein MotB